MTKKAVEHIRKATEHLKQEKSRRFNAALTSKELGEEGDEPGGENIDIGVKDTKWEPGKASKYTPPKQDDLENFVNEG